MIVETTRNLEFNVYSIDFKPNHIGVNLHTLPTVSTMFVIDINANEMVSGVEVLAGADYLDNAFENRSFKFVRENKWLKLVISEEKFTNTTFDTIDAITNKFDDAIKIEMHDHNLISITFKEELVTNNPNEKFSFEYLETDDH